MKIKKENLGSFSAGVKWVKEISPFRGKTTLESMLKTCKEKTSNHDYYYNGKKYTTNYKTEFYKGAVSELSSVIKNRKF